MTQKQEAVRLEPDAFAQTAAFGHCALLCPDNLRPGVWRVKGGRFALAVQHGHLVRIVARPGNGFSGHRALDPGDVVHGQAHFERTERFGQPVAPPRAYLRLDARVW